MPLIVYIDNIIINLEQAIKQRDMVIEAKDKEIANLKASTKTNLKGQ